MKIRTAVAAATMIIAASGGAMAYDVNKATVVDVHSGGLQGAGGGCLYVQYVDPAFPAIVSEAVMPFNQSPNTPQIVGAMSFYRAVTVSFNLGAPAGDHCSGAPAAPTILLPGNP